MLKEVPFITNFQEKENYETQAQNYLDKSDALLQNLSQLSENNTAAIAARIRAKQLLEGNEDEVMGF